MNESQKILRQLIKEHGRAKTKVMLSQMQQIINSPFNTSHPKASIIKAM